jgi:SAM-dependent methyltransferase
MGFSADWLALREPVDHAAVNRELAASVAERFAGPDHITIMDLGCGTGSNLRGSFHLFADSQHWTLVDHDPALLDAARARLSAWADEAHEAGEELMLAKGDKRLMVDFRQIDLISDLERVLDWRPDLITAAALFDLVSAPWLERFSDALAARKLPLYTVLTYDGRETWEPPHAADAAMLAAFNAHQRTDKGFGPAAGPDAVATLAAALTAKGYVAQTADSPWRLDAACADLTREVTAGVASAVRETGRVDEATIRAWLAAKSSAANGRATGLVGHLDLFARP